MNQVDSITAAPHLRLVFRAMVVSALTGHGDQELLQILPATTTADRVALVGMHDWTDPTLPAIAAEWGLSVFSPEALRSTSAPLLDWLGDTGATKVAIHFDVDTIDAEEIQLGLGADLGGLTSAQARRVVADIDDCWVREPEQTPHEGEIGSLRWLAGLRALATPHPSDPMRSRKLTSSTR